MSSSRSTLTLGAFFVAGCLAVVAYSYLTRVEPASENNSPRALVAASPSSAAPDSPPTAWPESGSPQDDAIASDPETAAPAAPPSPATGVSQWVSDATGEDARARAYAITALARAPKDAALPALRRVLDNGEPEVDRPLALESLQTLALEQGDEDGRIKDVLRQTVMHSGDEMFAEKAQRTLDTIP